jgi:hypothetical protein
MRPDGIRTPALVIARKDALRQGPLWAMNGAALYVRFAPKSAIELTMAAVQKRTSERLTAMAPLRHKGTLGGGPPAGQPPLSPTT